MALPNSWQWRLARWKNALRGFFGSGGNSDGTRTDQPRPKICPACGALVGISATKCHECGTNLRFSVAAISKNFGGQFGGQSPATTAILVANVLMFAATLLVGMKLNMGNSGSSILWSVNEEALSKLGWSIPFKYEGHSWFRLITAMYLHGGLLHIGFNLMVLMDIGPAVEEVYGSARYFFFYTVAGFLGFLASATLGDNVSVGASGAILGIAGLMIAITTRRGGAYMRAMRSRLISWVVSIFLIGFLFSGLRTDNWCHAGGFAAGFLLGRIFPDREPQTPSEKTTAYALGWISFLVVVISFVMVLKNINAPIGD